MARRNVVLVVGGALIGGISLALLVALAAVVNYPPAYEATTCIRVDFATIPGLSNEERIKFRQVLAQAAPTKLTSVDAIKEAAQAEGLQGKDLDVVVADITGHVSVTTKDTGELTQEVTITVGVSGHPK